MSNEQTKEMTLVDKTANKIRALVEKGELAFPANYNVENALKAAWLRIQQTQDRNKKPALTVCTPVSIMNALFDTALQGLNPGKNQCYYIVYGTKLIMQRSYFGTASVVKRILPTESISAQCIYEGDEIEYEINEGITKITKHKQSFGNLGKPIIGAYATIKLEGGKEFTTIMTMDDIKKSWGQSITKPIDAKGNITPDSTHGKFPQEMAKRTVIARACKLLVNTSDDSDLKGKDLLVESFNRTGEDEFDPMMEVDVNVAAEDLVPDAEETIDKTGEVKEKPKTTTKSKPKQQEIFDKGAELCSEADQKLINNLVAFLVDKGVDEQALFVDMVERYGANTYKELSATDADEYIKVLRDYQKQASQGNPVFK